MISNTRLRGLQSWFECWIGFEKVYLVSRSVRLDEWEVCSWRILRNWAFFVFCWCSLMLETDISFNLFIKDCVFVTCATKNSKNVLIVIGHSRGLRKIDYWCWLVIHVIPPPAPLALYANPNPNEYLYPMPNPPTRAHASTHSSHHSIQVQT